MTLRTIFNWYALRDESFVSPIVRGMSRVSWKKIARKRVLTDDEIRTLWRALDMTAPPFRQLVRLLLLSAQRRDECTKASLTELKGDLWTIPPERYKTELEHTVPLSALAMEQIAEAVRTDTDKDEDAQRGSYVFSTRHGRAPFNGFSKSKLRLDAEMLRLLREHDRKADLKPWRLHDLRRTGKTLMSRAGVRPDISERVLGHVIRGVEGVYDQHDYLAEKREALALLARQVQLIVEPDLAEALAALGALQKLPSANIILLPRAKMEAAN
jgi:integrase